MEVPQPIRNVEFMLLEAELSYQISCCSTLVQTIIITPRGNLRVFKHLSPSPPLPGPGPCWAACASSYHCWPVDKREGSNVCRRRIQNIRMYPVLKVFSIHISCWPWPLSSRSVFSPHNCFNQITNTLRCVVRGGAK